MDEKYFEKLDKKLDAIAKAAGINFCPVCAGEYEALLRCVSSPGGVVSPVIFVPTGVYKCKECGYEGKIPD
jgi:hypothetical protein